MKIGLIGLPHSGKTTIFNALAKTQAEVALYSNAKAEPNRATVEVIDERIQHLTNMYKPKKTVYASIEIIDFAGIKKESTQEDMFSGASLGMIRATDALALVVRNFDDELMGKPTPLQDIDQIETELLLSDLITAEKRIERIEASFKRGQKTNALQSEDKTLRRILNHLNDNLPLHSLELTENEIKEIRGFQFLTLKPQLIILNSDESSFGNNEKMLQDIEQQHKAIEFAGNFEMELAHLSEEEAHIFMEDMGIQQSARDRLTQGAYEILGYISFFTVGSDEVRAWNIHKGQTALEAAGTIHSDLARGFIRAECFSYKDLIECGSEKAVREKGRFRLEGKSYLVHDGDILNIRFSV